MIINKNANGALTTLKISGRLDTITAPELEAAVNGCIADTRELVLDFSELDYISSAGLRVLLKAQKSMMQKGSMKIMNASKSIMEVFDITGFSDILTIE